MATAALAALAATAAAATTSHRRSLTRDTASSGTSLGCGRDIATARHLALLVGLRRQLEDLTELHSLVRLHRLLNVGEPGSHFV